MKTAVIYARYSSDRQTEQSIEGQLRVCHEYAANNDIMVVGTYVDRAMTGKNDNRDDFQRMLKDSSKRAWEIVLVYKLDRFSRNKYEMAIHRKTLENNGIKLVSATENIPNTPEGIILESLLEGMAQYYSAELAQKVTRGLRESRLKGLFTGGKVPYGYKVKDKVVSIDENTSKVVIDIYEQYAGGKYVKDIISDLTERGILFNGKPFARNTIYKILKSEKYAGIAKYGDCVYDNIYPRIVPQELYDIVKNKVDENKYGKHDSTAIYLLKNKVKCGYCGKSIKSASGTSYNKTINRYYCCSTNKNGGHCRKIAIRKDDLEKLVVDTTFKIFDNPQTINPLVEHIMKLHHIQETDQTYARLLMKERDDTQKAIDNIVDCMAQGIVTRSTKAKLEELESKLDEINVKLNKELVKNHLEITKEDIAKYIRTGLKKDPRLMIKLLVKEIILYNDKIEIYYNYIDSVNTIEEEKKKDFQIYTDSFKSTTGNAQEEYEMKVNALI